jgi:hypothetical protein
MDRPHQRRMHTYIIIYTRVDSPLISYRSQPPHLCTILHVDVGTTIPPHMTSHNNSNNIVKYGNRRNGWLEECLIADRCGDGSVFVPTIVSLGLPVARDEDTLADSRRPRHRHIHPPNGLLLHHPSLLGGSSSPSKRQCTMSSTRSIKRLRSNNHRSMAQVTNNETKTNS